jgi:hypothetical protein
MSSGLKSEFVTEELINLPPRAQHRQRQAPIASAILDSSLITESSSTGSHMETHPILE